MSGLRGSAASRVPSGSSCGGSKYQLIAAEVRAGSAPSPCTRCHQPDGKKSASPAARTTRERSISADRLGIAASGGEFELVYAAGHCHAPACLSTEVYACAKGTPLDACNTTNGELVCRTAPVYGGTGAPELDGTRFDDALADAALVPAMNRFLGELDALVESEEHISPGGVSYDDILYFPHLRTLSLVRGLEFPPRTRAYMERMSEKADVPLLWQMAV